MPDEVLSNQPRDVAEISRIPRDENSIRPGALIVKYGLVLLVFGVLYIISKVKMSWGVVSIFATFLGIETLLLNLFRGKKWGMAVWMPFAIWPIGLVALWILVFFLNILQGRLEAQKFSDAGTGGPEFLLL